MSFSIITNPLIYQPASNPIEFVVSSTNSGACDFTYLADVYVNGLFAIRLKTFPDSPLGRGRFRIDRVLQDFLSKNFDPQITNFTANVESIVDYQVEFRERYITTADCTGDPSTSAVLSTSTKRYAWNGALQYHEWPDYAIGQFDLEDSESRFLTSVPNSIKLTLDDYFTMKFIQGLSSGTGTAKKLIVKTYDFANTLISTYTLNNSFFGSGVTRNLLITAPIGPLNISGFVTLDENVNYYTAVIQDNSSADLSETKKFYVRPRCTKYKPYRFWWLNRLGGFDAMTFDLKSVRALDIIRNLFTKLLPSSYEIGDRGETVTSIDARSAYTVYSDWMSEDEAVWLQELFTSPEVYVYETSKRNTVTNVLSVVCNCPQTSFVITGAANNGDGTAQFYIDDSLGGAGSIPIGTHFSYTGTGFSSIGSPSSGTHKLITGYNSGGAYYTTDVVSTINAGAIITGTLDIEEYSCVTTFELDDTLPIGTEFSYRVDDGSPIGLVDAGFGKVTGYGVNPGDHETDVECLSAAGATITGTLKYEKLTTKLIPIVITNPQYEEKIKANIKNIQYTMEFKPSHKENVQRL